jgi:hypothetical protein
VRPDLAAGVRLVGGLAPHAGWVCSGRVAALTWRALHDHSDAVVIFITGSVHTMDLDRPALDAADAWRTPLGDVLIDTDLRDAIAALDAFDIVDAAHRDEHALEVQLPLAQALWGERLRIVPCMIPPAADAARWGNALGELFRGWREPVLAVGSIDLTHYGPDYRFTPRGIGDEATRWAHEVNDRRLLDSAEHLAADAICTTAKQHHCTCGGGAAAAVVAAAAAMGAARGTVLAHTHSARELAALGYPAGNNSVGYASVVSGNAPCPMPVD